MISTDVIEMVEARSDIRPDSESDLNCVFPVTTNRQATYINQSTLLYYHHSSPVQPAYIHTIANQQVAITGLNVRLVTEPGFSKEVE